MKQSITCVFLVLGLLPVTAEPKRSTEFIPSQSPSETIGAGTLLNWLNSSVEKSLPCGTERRRNLSPSVLPYLKAHAESDDPEVVVRIEQVVETVKGDLLDRVEKLLDVEK